MKPLYQVLGVDESADPSTIKSAYRRLARDYHPDHNREETAEVRRERERKFLEIQLSYEVLMDPVKRRAYDLKGEGGISDLLAAIKNIDPSVFSSIASDGIPIVEAALDAAGIAGAYAEVGAACVRSGDYRGALKAGHGVLDSVGTVGQAAELLGKSAIGKWLAGRLKKRS